MASILDRIWNRSPAPYTSRRSTGATGRTAFGTSSKAEQLEVMAGVSTLFKVVSKRAGSVASTEWVLYQKAKDDRRMRTNTRELEERVAVADHPAFTVWQNPNPHMTASYLRRVWSMHKDLAGEAFLAPDRPNTPRELWPFRPDRMSPIKSAENFLDGWTYTDPDNKTTTFGPKEIWAFIDPNPTDPYRGLSPVMALMADLGMDRAAADWNRNFFLNGAEFGGAIEVADGLTDDEFDRLQRHLNNNHRGAQNAHRWMIAEGSKVVPFSTNHKDMQFEKLRGLSRDLVREAYAMPKTLLGIGESVNRATAQAAWAIYLEQEVKDRLDEMRDWLNTQWLPRFGQSAARLEFDYVDPVPTDQEADVAELVAKSTAAATLKAAGWDPDSVLEVVGLPPMELATEDGSLDAESVALLIQKMYLGVPEKAVVSQEEARDILRGAGVKLGSVAPGAASAPPGVAEPAEDDPEGDVAEGPENLRVVR